MWKVSTRIEIRLILNAIYTFSILIFHSIIDLQNLNILEVKELKKCVYLSIEQPIRAQFMLFSLSAFSENERISVGQTKVKSRG